MSSTEDGLPRFVIRDLASGEWLKEFDPDVTNPNDPNDPRTGFAEFTDKLDEAMTFASPVDGWNLWRTQSTVRPLRPDGKPNRPLTHFTITVEPLHKAVST